jgi:hypothetical protein
VPPESGARWRFLPRRGRHAELVDAIAQRLPNDCVYLNAHVIGNVEQRQEKEPPREAVKPGRRRYPGDAGYSAAAILLQSRRSWLRSCARFHGSTATVVAYRRTKSRGRSGLTDRAGDRVTQDLGLHLQQH